MITISKQQDLDDAITESVTVLYIGKPGEVNTYEPVSTNSNTPALSEWTECFTDDGTP
jgi:hypothetical protein